MAAVVLLTTASIGWAEDVQTDKKADGSTLDGPTFVELRVQMHRTLAALIEARAADTPDEAKIEKLSDKLQAIRKQMWADGAAQGWRGPRGPWSAQQWPMGRMGRGPGAGGPGPGNWQGRGYGRGQGGPGQCYGGRCGAGRGMGPGMGRGMGCQGCKSCACSAKSCCAGCKACPVKGKAGCQAAAGCQGCAGCKGCPCSTVSKDCTKDCANCPVKDCDKKCDVDLGKLGKYVDGDAPPNDAPAKPASKTAKAKK